MTTKSITLDVWEPSDVRVKVNQGEIDARFLKIKLTDKNKSMDLTGKTVIFYATKPDDNLIFNNCDIVDAAKGIVSLGLTSQMSIVAGIMRDCEIDILDPGIEKLKVKGLTLEICRTTNFESAVESTSEFTALDIALQEAQEIIEAYSEENIMGKILSLDGAGSGLDADLLDGKHGSEYASSSQGAKADTAVQGIKGNGITIPLDSNKIANITPDDIGAAPKTLRINNKPLSNDINLSPSDIGAATANHGNHIPAPQVATSNTYLRNDNSWHTIIPQDIDAATSIQGVKADTAIQGLKINGTNISPNVNKVIELQTSDLGAVPINRTVNGKSLSENISITTSDIGAATSAQGVKADTAIQGLKINGTNMPPNDNKVIELQTSDLGAVPINRTVNGKSLSENISITTSDIGAATSTQGGKADTAIQGLKINGTNIPPNVNKVIELQISDLGAVPISRTVNGKPLSGNIAITTSDIGAATSAQGAKADSAIQGLKINGTNIPPNDNKVIELQTSDLGAVPISRTVNGQPLSGNVLITASDIGAATSRQGGKADTAIQGLKINGTNMTPDANQVIELQTSDLGAVPITRTVNGKPLSGNISITTSDIGAATSTQGGKADTAVQGIKLNGELVQPDENNFIDILTSEIEGATAEQGRKADTAVQGIRGNGSIIPKDSNNIINVTPHIIGAVPVTRTINNRSLDGDITLLPTDIGAATTQHNHKISELSEGVLPIEKGGTNATTGTQALQNLGGVPISRTINTKPLTSDITLSATDVGAATTAQGNKADSAIQGVKVNGTLQTPDNENIVNVAVSQAVSYSAQIGTSWDVGSNGEYYQTITVNGILETDIPFIDLVQSNDIQVAKDEIDSWSLINKIITQNDRIIVYCYGIAPAIAINISILCFRQTGGNPV